MDTIRYWPVPSVTALRAFSISIGLEASTVTPGSTAPDTSLTTPVMVACCASTVTGTSRRTAGRINDFAVRFTSDLHIQYPGAAGRLLGAHATARRYAVSRTFVARVNDLRRGLAARGESVASHRDGRGASRARRDDREYREYLREEQRSPRGCIARRMQPDFHHGLLGRFCVRMFLAVTGKEDDSSMKHRTVLLISCFAALVGSAAGQTKDAGLRTPDGQPDIQGIWSFATLTPLERPDELSGKEFFTKQEAAEYERKVLERNNMD